MVDPAKFVWERCACDWCGSLESELVFRGPDRLEGLPGEFTLVRCLGCGTYRQDPRLAWESLVDFYPEDYASHPRLVRDESTRWRQLDKRYGPWKRVRAVARYQPRGRLLEVGCGTGLFLEEAQRRGNWELMGIEPSQRAARYVQENLGLPVHQGRFEEVTLPAESLDVLVMWNVLEHLSHPVQDLRRASALLKPGGWLVFAVPNAESLGARLFGRFWVGWDLPRHLYIFPWDTLEEILTDLGFRVVDRRGLSTAYSVLGHSLDFWSQSWADRHPAWRRWLLRAYYTPLVRALLVLPLWLLDRLKRSTIITIFAQKQSGALSKK